MSELTLGHGELGAGHRSPETVEVLGYRGRHAVDEDAGLTPIFHALSRGSWRTRHESPGDAIASVSTPAGSTPSANVSSVSTPAVDAPAVSTAVGPQSGGPPSAAVAAVSSAAAANDSAAGSPPGVSLSGIAASLAKSLTGATPVADGAPEAAAEPTAAPDPMERFRRDPLAAPLPTSVLAVVPNDEQLPISRRRAGSGAHAMPEVRRGGRHHRRLIPLDGGAVPD